MCLHFMEKVDFFLKLWHLHFKESDFCWFRKSSETDSPTHGSVILKKRMEIERTLVSSDTLLER